MFQKICEREYQMKTEIELIVEDRIVGEHAGARKQVGDAAKEFYIMAFCK